MGSSSMPAASRADRCAANLGTASATLKNTRLYAEVHLKSCLACFAATLTTLRRITGFGSGLASSAYNFSMILAKSIVFHFFSAWAENFSMANSPSDGISYCEVCQENNPKDGAMAVVLSPSPKYHARAC